MKKQLLGSWLILGLAFLFCAVSISAQAGGSYRAEIPFDFAVGNEIYEAGTYIVNLRDPTDPATVLSLRNQQNHQLQARVVVQNGSTSANGSTKIVFARYGNQYVMKRIASPDFGFNAPKSKVDSRLAKKSKEPGELLSVVLSK